MGGPLGCCDGDRDCMSVFGEGVSLFESGDGIKAGSGTVRGVKLRGEMPESARPLNVRRGGSIAPEERNESNGCFDIVKQSVRGEGENHRRLVRQVRGRNYGLSLLKLLMLAARGFSSARDFGKMWIHCGYCCLSLSLFTARVVHRAVLVSGKDHISVRCAVSCRIMELGVRKGPGGQREGLQVEMSIVTWVRLPA